MNKRKIGELLLILGTVLFVGGADEGSRGIPEKRVEYLTGGSK